MNTEKGINRTGIVTGITVGIYFGVKLALSDPRYPHVLIFVGFFPGLFACVSFARGQTGDSHILESRGEHLPDFIYFLLKIQIVPRPLGGPVCKLA